MLKVDVFVVEKKDELGAGAEFMRYMSGCGRM
jgi:hypothetical protein